MRVQRGDHRPLNRETVANAEIDEHAVADLRHRQVPKIDARHSGQVEFFLADPVIGDGIVAAAVGDDERNALAAPGPPQDSAGYGCTTVMRS